MKKDSCTNLLKCPSHRVATILTLHEDSLQYWKDLDTDYKASFQVALRKTTASNLKYKTIEIYRIYI